VFAFSIAGREWGAGLPAHRAQRFCALTENAMNEKERQSRRRRRTMIGYTEYRTNLPGGQFAAFTSMRAYVVQVDGAGRQAVGPELTRGAYTWTQFAGWSPDGRLGILHRGWESPENAAWEAKHRTFRMTEGWLHDIYLLDPATGGLTNVTAVE